MIDFHLVHDGKRWVASNGTLSVGAATLPEVDRAVADALARSEGPGRRVVVRMTYASSALPEWMRQYAQHYFSRLVTLDLPGPGAAGGGHPCPS